MRIVLKFLLWLATGLLAIIAGLIALLYLVDVNVYRDRIQQHVSTAFGRDVILQGQLELEPSLVPRFVVNGIKITNPDWASRRYLATIERFDIRVSLLSLLRRELEVASLEVHGVDLLVEQAADGTDNFTFFSTGEAADAPAIERLSLYDIEMGYAAPDSQLKSLHIDQALARMVPGQAVELEVQTVVDEIPVKLTLGGEAQDDLHAEGPWSLALKGTIGGLSLEVNGHLPQSTDWRRGEYRLDLKGPNLDDIAAISGYALPRDGPIALGANLRLKLDEYIEFDDIKANLGASNLEGKIRWEPEHPRSRLVANFVSERLQLDKLSREQAGQTAAIEQLNHSIDAHEFFATDMDVEFAVQQLEGLTKPIQEILLKIRASEERLELTQAQATINNVLIDAQATLPWGENLAPLAKNGISVRQLLQHADLAVRANASEDKVQHAFTTLGHQVNLGLTTLEATASPGKGLSISASAKLNDAPVQVNLQAASLTELLKRPEGPWNDLALDIASNDIQIHANGNVERPFDTRGFDINYAINGTKFETLLPLLNLLLPLEGSYSLTGHFNDLPDRTVFDQLKVTIGSSDIGGSISVIQGEPRPRLIADLHSELIYLPELLPIHGAQTDTPAPATNKVIPNYNLPLERMRMIDSEISFSGARLRTAAGDLGDININATLRDGVFKVDQFRVRGWEGALIDTEATIDASKNPPYVDWQWIARQLDYGYLLKQADFSKTVEGTMDITLRLAGNGGTRQEFLSNADGQLIIVGSEGRFGSRRLDLWGSDLATIMLSPEWRREDVTNINCLVARIDIEDGIASSDEVIIDTRRITIGMAGTLNLQTEELNLVIAPRPKRTSLVSLTNPVRVTGTMAAPAVTVTKLPRNRVITAAGAGLLAGLINPGYLIFSLSQIGSGVRNPCTEAVNEAMIIKGSTDEFNSAPE